MMLLLMLFAGALGFFGMRWLDPKWRGKARWNYVAEDWRN